MSSAPTTLDSRPEARTAASNKRLPNSVLGIIFFIITETMFFAALMSANTIARATVPGGVWPPAGQPRLPLERTAFNTVFLFASGALLWYGSRQMKSSRERGLGYVAATILAGVTFICLQGVEWLALIREGLTMTSGSHGAFFYLIVGMHALHAVVAMVALTWVYLRLRRGTSSGAAFAVTQVFWYFVVLLWPVIYLRVYL